MNFNIDFKRFNIFMSILKERYNIQLLRNEKGNELMKEITGYNTLKE